MDNLDVSPYAPEEQDFTALADAALRRTNINVNNLLDFLKYRTVTSGTMDVNIFAPKIATYNISDNDIPVFFALLEKCRRDGIRMHYCEKQCDYSGIMIDFDLNHMEAVSQLDSNLISDITACVITTLLETLSLDPQQPTIKIYIGVLHSANIRQKSIEGRIVNRESLHLLIPSIKISKKHKKYLLKKLQACEDLQEIIPKSIKDHTANFIDTASATVPVHFIGCCKNDPAKTPDDLEVVYEYKVNNRNGKMTVNTIDLNKISNICYEFSLNYANVDGEGYHFHKAQYECLDSLRGEIYSVTNPNVSESEKNFVLSEINKLALIKPDIRIINDLVTILDDARTNDYTEWRKVIVVLASGGNDYKNIALNFTMRSDKFQHASYFNKEWDHMLNSLMGQYNMYAIYSWAKKDNPVEYNKIVGKSIHKTFQQILFDNSIAGEVTHYHAALILHKCVGYKYVSDYDGKDKCWYEYVSEDDDQRDTKLHKWNKSCVVPSSLFTYISQVLPVYLQRTLDYINNKLLVGLDSKSAIAQFYIKVVSNLHKSFTNLNNNGFKQSVINEAFHQFLRPKLTWKIDKQEMILPVGNGIILLGENPVLLEQYHTNIVTRHSDINYHPYDPTDPDIIKVEKILRDLFHETEQDTYEFIMCYIASSLAFKRGPEFLLFIRGGGSNGKTMLADMLTGALGKCFCDKTPSTLLTRPLGDADKPNPAAMALEHLRVTYYDEFEPGSIILDYNLKSVINGEFSGRNLYQKQTTVVSKARHIAFSNHVMRIRVTDFGTWRRLLYTELKMCFYYENHPQKPYDANNSYHRIRDDEIKDTYIHTQRAKEAMLSILVKWYQIFLLRYNGSINNIPRFTINDETERFRISQDHINRFVTTRVVKTNPDFVTTIADMTGKYVEWYKENVSRKDVVDINAKTTTEQLVKESYLKKFECIHGDEIHGYTVHGYRALGLNEMKQMDEEFISVIQERTINRVFTSVDHQMTLDEYYKQYINNKSNSQVQ